VRGDLTQNQGSKKPKKYICFEGLNVFSQALEVLEGIYAFFEKNKTFFFTSKILRQALDSAKSPWSPSFICFTANTFILDAREQWLEPGTKADDDLKLCLLILVASWRIPFSRLQKRHVVGARTKTTFKNNINHWSPSLSCCMVITLFLTVGEAVVGVSTKATFNDDLKRWPPSLSCCTANAFFLAVREQLGCS
jgi:hypothetical protein